MPHISSPLASVAQPGKLTTLYSTVIQLQLHTTTTLCTSALQSLQGTSSGFFFICLTFRNSWEQRESKSTLCVCPAAHFDKWTIKWILSLKEKHKMDKCKHNKCEKTTGGQQPVQVGKGGGWGRWKRIDVLPPLKGKNRWKRPNYCPLELEYSPQCPSYTFPNSRLYQGCKWSIH